VLSSSRPVFPATIGPEVTANPETTRDFEALLAYLKQSRGFDFTAYKRSGLMRRMTVRMQAVGISRFADYQDFLQVDPEEFTRLFNTILINVTGFFRDPTAWEYVAGNVLPFILGDGNANHGIRAWSAGCASGEEAYTIAMLLAEYLGFEGFRERVKIYGTDLDENALTQARQATYSFRAVQDLPPELVRKYFDQQDERVIFNKELRRSLVFGRHDLIQDAPISRVNLLVCRNCMMYFNSEAQSRILSRFHFALADGGVLFLGKAETLLTRSDTFQAVDVKRRLFAKADRRTRSCNPPTKSWKR
jgi:two-component system, chemotaxis family, CheB/CheR fusion protein